MERENGDSVPGDGRRERGVGGGKKMGDEW